MVFKDLVEKFAGEHGNEIAFSVYDGEKVKNIRYHTFAADILQVAGYFVNHQIKGKHIAIAGENSYQWIVILFATMATGNIAIPLNSSLPSDILQWQCKKADVELICYDDSDITIKTGHIPTVSFEEVQSQVSTTNSSLYVHDKNETVMMLFTSGTTGRSKAVMLSVENMFSSAANMFSNQDVDRLMVTLPLYHVGSIRALLNRVCNNRMLAIGRGPKYVFMDMAQLNPTHVGMVPSMSESLVKIMNKISVNDLQNYVGNGFKGIISVGASLKTTVAQYLLDHNVELLVIFGMTESTGDGSGYLLDKKHINSIGKPDGNIDFRIEEGEIVLRSDAIMKGYYKDAEETEKVIVDGWLHTGDMGFCDEDGYYYISGRKKNVIILSNGENVNPEEIEETLSNCEAVEECLVYSDGKGICADIYTNNQDIVSVFIRSYNGDVPMYRQVYKVNYTNEPLEKTGSGKIKRKENR